MGENNFARYESKASGCAISGSRNETLDRAIHWDFYRNNNNTKCKRRYYENKRPKTKQRTRNFGKIDEDRRQSFLVIISVWVQGIKGLKETVHIYFSFDSLFSLKGKKITK